MELFSLVDKYIQLYCNIANARALKLDTAFEVHCAENIDISVRSFEAAITLLTYQRLNYRCCLITKPSLLFSKYQHFLPNLKGLSQDQKCFHLFSDSEAYYEQMGPIPSSTGSLDIALDDAFCRLSTQQSWPRDRKLTQSCWCLH